MRCIFDDVAHACSTCKVVPVQLASGTTAVHRLRWALIQFLLWWTVWT